MKINNKKTFIFSLLTLALIICAYILYTYPQKCNYTLNGIKYRLGQENSSYEETIKININGRLSRKLLGGANFKGKITIGELEIPMDNSNMEINFDKFNYGNLVHYYFDPETHNPKSISVGSIFINNRFNNLTILVMEPETLSAPSKSWNGSNGLMISAPAFNRAEAIKLSNDLMKKSLSGSDNNFILK